MNESGVSSTGWSRQFILMALLVAAIFCQAISGVLGGALKLVLLGLSFVLLGVFCRYFYLFNVRRLGGPIGQKFSARELAILAPLVAVTLVINALHLLASLQHFY
jgi:hypothetical protein